jgi:putative ABC transport system substrate-binding protein
MRSVVGLVRCRQRCSKGLALRRRNFLTLLAGAAVSWPVTVPAQQIERQRNIGVLLGLEEPDPEIPLRIAILREALGELGWTDGQNVRIHYRSGIGAGRVQALANELVALQPGLIVAGSSVAVRALLRETRTIPIVFVTASDPVGDGFVASLAQPGGNATGFTGAPSSVGAKWLELLQEVSPDLRHFTAIFNPDSAADGGGYFLPPLRAAAASMSVGVDVAAVHDLTDIETVFAARGPAGGILVLPDQFISAHRDFIVESAARHRVPAIYPSRSFTKVGGLMSYGIDLLDLYRRVPSYVDRILRGARPADLPVQVPARIELVVNLSAASRLGLAVPRIMLARADEVIQ